MQHSELPPSSSDKWMKCHAWLSTIRQLPDRDDSSEAAEEGTLAHHYLEQGLLGNLQELAKAPEDMFDHLMPLIEWVESQAGFLYPEMELDYGDYFGFVGLTGTSDVILDHAEHLTVADLKYGRQMVEVTDNTQLMIYLVGAVHKFGVRERYRLVILQPRAKHADGPIREVWVTHAEFLDFAYELNEAIMGNYRGGPATVGHHCRKYCKALGSCKAVRDYSLNLLRSTPLD